jgi:hypothetical protein
MDAKRDEASFTAFSEASLGQSNDVRLRLALAMI